MMKEIPRTHNLSRLLYTSRSAISGSRKEQIAQMHALTGEARARNRKAHLTGSLLFVDDTFIQVLEGPTQNMESIFEAICCDLRHRDITLVDLLPASKRMFEDWEMAFLAGEEESASPATADLLEIRYMVGVNARKAENQMLDLVRRAA